MTIVICEYQIMSQLWFTPCTCYTRTCGTRLFPTPIFWRERFEVPHLHDWEKTVFKRTQGVKRQAFRSILSFTGSTGKVYLFFWHFFGKWKLGKAAFGECHWQVLILRGAEWCSCSPWCQNSAWKGSKWGLDVWEERQIPGAALHAFRYPNTFNHLAGVNMVQWNIRQMY